MTMFIATVAIIMAGCQRKPVMAHSRFVHLPEAGWQQTLPLTFNPVYDDSTMAYELSLAIRHHNDYDYSNLSLVVDVIAADSTVSRMPLNFMLADEHGNWSGGGFGTLYQAQYTLKDHVKPDDARSIIVWQAMQDCDTLKGLADVGIIVKPL